jgi:prepilin-type N-terminal cleavage/methylation domain-containing protein
MSRTRGNQGGRRGFTLVEVLAALLCMSIVIPVAMNALSVASRAGEFADRKATAVQIAERVLNEQVVMAQAQASGSGSGGASAQSGSVDDGPISYRWNVTTGQWDQDNMQLMTVQVMYPLRGQEFSVKLSTLVKTQ